MTGSADVTSSRSEPWASGGCHGPICSGSGRTERRPSPSTPKAVIMVVLEGGPSQSDMYDLKPEAPAGVRGEFQTDSDRVPGFDICELLPRQAQITDKLSLVRSMKLSATNHDMTRLFTGFLNREARPAFGAMVSRLSARPGRQLPAYATYRRRVRTRRV